MEDLEDNLEDQIDDDNVNPGPSRGVDLFGDDDELPEDEEEYQVSEQEEEEEEAPREEEEAPQAGQAAEASTAEDRRAALLKLAQKKKREAEGGDEPRKKKKKKKEGDKGDGKESRRSRRGDAGRPQEEGPRRARAANEPELPSDEIEEEAGDDDFIDDEGALVDEEAAGSDGADDEDLAGMPPPEEAVEVARGEEEEADDGDDPFGHKKRKKRKETDQQMAMVVDDKIAKMEAAAEADMEQHEQSRPAVQKLKFLAEVEEFLAQKKYHELFVSAGGLGVLKAWLEPYTDGSLPNTRIRSAVLKACKLLPIDTSREDMKSQLKKSQLGNRVMFLLKCPDETTANRQIARELVQAWSRPIFFDAQVESEKRKVRYEQLKVARAAALDTQREVEQVQKAAEKPRMRPGDAGYRWHASIPMASKLDYVVEPNQDDRIAAAAVQAAAHAAAVAPKDTRFAKKMREVQRKQKSTTARAAKPSVEGRTITVMST